MTDKAVAPGVDSAQRSRGLIASAALALLVMLLFLWWASHYVSLVERLGEWQFDTFGRYFPSLTVVLAVAVLGLPLALLVAWRRNERRKQAARDGLMSPQDRVLIAINGALRGRIFFLVVAAFAAVWAIAALLSLLVLPTSEGAVATITGSEIKGIGEGPARYAAGRTLDRVGRLEERVGLFHRVTYVAPVRPVGARTGPIRFFTEVDRLAGQQPRFSPIKQGILVDRGLPGELVNLYRGVGLPTNDRPFLLVRDLPWLRWRPLVLAGQLALLALGAFGASWLLRRQAGRLDRFLAGGTSQG